MRAMLPSSSVSTQSVLDCLEERYGDLVRFVSRKTGNAQEAKDLVHDAWVRLAEREAGATAESSATRPENPGAYLLTVAQNLAVDAGRREQWLQGFVRDSQAGGGTPHSPDVADRLMYRQAILAVDQALAALPERARQVFVAHRIHGESQANVASQLGVSINTVERDMMLATTRLEAALHRWRGASRSPVTPGTAHRGRRRTLSALLGLAGVATTGGIVWRHWQREALRWTGELATLRARTLEHEAPDGSRITLDSDSRVELAYDADRRIARLLQGAAFFAVAREAERPFIVEAGNIEVAVLGTRFAVDRAQDGTVTVEVESGRVQVRAPVGVFELRDGQGLRLVANRPAQALSGPAAPWRRGELQFDAVPLRVALARLERYTDTSLQVSDDAARLAVSGSLRIVDVQDWLAALPSVLPVRVRRQEGGGIEISMR